MCICFWLSVVLIMWKFFLLYVLILFWWIVDGDIHDQVKSTMGECCNVGLEFRRSHTEEECSASQPVPSEVPPGYRSIYLMCIMARAVCCTGQSQRGNTNETTTKVLQVTEQSPKLNETKLHTQETNPQVTTNPQNDTVDLHYTTSLKKPDEKINQVDNASVLKCPMGYKLGDDHECVDINECETGEATCKSGIVNGTSHICFNIKGSYRCQEITCSPGYQLRGKFGCSKTERKCSRGDWECAHQPSSISYNYITFASKLYIPESHVKLFTMQGPTWPNAMRIYYKMMFELRVIEVNAPPSVKDKADINDFLLIQNDDKAIVSLVRSLEGPQSIELELSMELYTPGQFRGTDVAKLYFYVSEYEF